MKATLYAGSLITFDYGSLSAADGLVGLSPGSNSATGLPLNLSFGPNVIVPGIEAPYQLFSAQSPSDLAGSQVSWVLDASGNPTMSL